MQAATTAKKPRKQAISGRFWAGRTYRGRIKDDHKIDPACGSGSLLLKSAKILGLKNVRQGFYGQEINITTYNLCRMNMFLHDVDYDKFDIACEDTLTAPQHWDDEPFEVIVSNEAVICGLTPEKACNIKEFAA